MSSISHKPLSDHAAYLSLNARSLPDPPPSDAIDLFNRLLARARARLGPGSLVQEIPELDPDTPREVLVLWAFQLSAAFEG
jgi:hypothetical protein